MARLTYFLLISLSFSAPIFSMVCDNQFFPFFPIPFSRTEEQPSHFAISAFFTTASCAYDDTEREKTIPELWGKYDQDKLGQALELVGKNNPLPGEFRGVEIPWDMDGKIQAQGALISWEQKLFGPVSFGFSWLLMRVHSCQSFCLKLGGSSLRVKQPGDKAELEEARRLMNKELGMTEMNSGRVGMGDFDCYFRVGNIWDYELKCRKIDAGVSFGMMMPSGLSRDINSAATVPFGGGGLWGVYLRADAEFELKEDMKFGLSARASKRFKRRLCKRLPVAGEHPFFGALVTEVDVDPGANFIFSPYFSMENLRQGLGIRVGAHLVLHGDDVWIDTRSRADREKLPASTKECKSVSEWGADYGSINVFYDFGKMSVDRGHKPIVTLAWDFPFMMFVSSNIVKTHRISLDIEVNF